MIFYLKIFFTTLHPLWVLEKQTKNYRANLYSEVSISRIETISGKTLGYRKTISHGGYVRDWVHYIGRKNHAST